MSASTSRGDDLRNALKRSRATPESNTQYRVELPSAPPEPPPPSKAFRLYPDWAQRGPFW